MKCRLAELLAVGAIVLLASCSGSGDAMDGPTGADAATDTDAAAGTDGGVLSSLVCEDPPPTEIALGVPVNNQLDLEDTYRCFWIDVPAGLSDVAFELSGLSADLEMFLGYGFLVRIQYPGLGEFWAAPAAGSADETIVIANPKPGPYFVYVRPDELNAVSPFTLVANSNPQMIGSLTGAPLPNPNECAAPALTIEPGTAVNSEIAVRDEPPLLHEYFCLQAPAGLSRITVEVTELTDSLEVLVRQGNRSRIWSDRSRIGPERTVVIDNPGPGAYFIDVAAAVLGASSPFSITVRTD